MGHSVGWYYDAFCSSEFACSLCDTLCRPHDRAKIAIDVAAEGSEHDFPAAALEEPTAKLDLQSFDALRKRGLADAALARSARKGPAFTNSKEVMDLL
jgi:hypothetical protein